MKPIIFAPQPAPGDVIHFDSLFADFKRGSIGVETLNWAWLCGLDVYHATETNSDAILAECVYEDVETWLDNLGEPDSFISALGTSPKAFLGLGQDLDPELFAALDVLVERVPDPVGYIRERALDAMLR